MAVQMLLRLVQNILRFFHNLHIYLYMQEIRYRISRCDTLNNDRYILIRNICISVERADNTGNQISHCIQLTGSQCIGKSNEESVDLAFNLMSSSIAESSNKLLQMPTSIINSYYIPNL